MEEIVWMNSNIQEPPKRSTRSIDGIYLVTVRCKNWYVNKPKSMFMVWKENDRTGRNEWYLITGARKPSTYEVTHWAYMPKPAERYE